MHTMERTNKVITIIGLVLEAFNSLGMFFGAYLLGSVLDRELFLELDPSMDIQELDLILNIYGTFSTVLYVLGAIVLVVFIVNIYIFGKLIKGNIPEESVKKVYTYQFVWGIINIFMNTIAGILYIVSGYQGMKGNKELKDTREGI